MRTTVMARLLLCGSALLGSLGAVHRTGAVVVSRAEPNRIVLENRHPGSTGWQLPWAGYTVTDDTDLQIKGYAGAENVAPGETVPLKITVNPAQTYTVDVFRLGHYQGLGGRLMEHLGPFDGVTQPPCTVVAATRMNVCSWKTSVGLHVPESWISGVYVAVLSNARGYQSLVPFWVVEQSRHSDMLYLSSLNTYEAYNNFPYDPPASNPQGLPQSGHSLYDYNSAGNMPAVKVTFDRPFNSQYGGPGDGGLYDFEPELISFIEGTGYDVTYANEPVTDQKPWINQFHKVVVIGGHAEYQTMTNYDALQSARDGGVGLAFISGNEIYWQVRYEALDGMPRRIVVGYKTTAPDPCKDRRYRTIKWRQLGRPEQRLIGVQLPSNGWMNWGGQPWVPRDTDHWAFAGTGLVAGVPVKAQISGYEIDAYDPKVPKPDGTGYTLLSASPFLTYRHHEFIQNSSIYRSFGGNWVWASGSMDWSWGLSPGGSKNGHGHNVRHGLQVMTRNILNRMILEGPRNARSLRVEWPQPNEQNPCQ